MSKVHVTNAPWNPRPPVPAGLCPGCYGWGHPFFPWKGKACMKLDAPCDVCGGSGKAQTGNA